MKDSQREAERWLRQAENDLEFARLGLGAGFFALALIGLRAPEAPRLRELAGVLDQYYVPTRYPNGLPGGVPFEAFGQVQAAAAVDGAERFLVFARGQLGRTGN